MLDQFSKDKTLRELFSESLFNSPAVSIEEDKKISEATGLLSRHLESFTDSLVVTKNSKPIGVVGGKEVLDGVLKNPFSQFFEGTIVGQIKDSKITITSSDSTLSGLLDQWSKTRRAFSIIPNPYGGYSAISARKILEIPNSTDLNLMVSSIPKKTTVVFDLDFTIKRVIELMFEKRTRKLLLANSTKFISDRIIIEKITRELDYLKNVPNFLNMSVKIFSLGQAKKISESSNIREASKTMYEMTSPYLISNGRVITPWDMVICLLSTK